MRISDWSSDVCSSDLSRRALRTAICRRPPRPRRGTACRHVVPQCRRWRYDALLVSRLYPAETAPSRVPSGFCGMYSYLILTKFSENWSIGSALDPDEPPVWTSLRITSLQVTIRYTQETWSGGQE